MFPFRGGACFGGAVNCCQIWKHDSSSISLLTADSKGHGFLPAVLTDWAHVPQKSQAGRSPESHQEIMIINAGCFVPVLKQQATGLEKWGGGGERGTDSQAHND